MSKLVVSELAAPTKSNGAIAINASDYLYLPGTVIRKSSIISRLGATFASNTTGDGTRITNLDLSVTPRLSNSMLYIQYMINGELHQDNVFTLLQDGLLITTAGYEGYNNQSGNVRHSGYVAAQYDQNESSTPSNWYIQYFVPSGSTTTRVYSPAVRSSSGTAFTFYLNRTVSSTGSDAYESMQSWGICLEIAQ